MITSITILNLVQWLAYQSGAGKDKLIIYSAFFKDRIDTKVIEINPEKSSFLQRI